MKYWINIDGIQQGPLSYEQLAEMKFNPEDAYVWHNGLDDWRKIGDVPELAQIASTAAVRYCAMQPDAAQKGVATQSAEAAEEEKCAEPEVKEAEEEKNADAGGEQQTQPEAAQPQQQSEPESDEEMHTSAGAVPPPLPHTEATVPPIPPMQAPLMHAVPQPMPQMENKPQPTYLIWAVVVSLLCCQITGVISLVYAALASSANSSGAYYKAKKYSETARLWIIVSIALGLVYMPFAILFALAL